MWRARSADPQGMTCRASFGIGAAARAACGLALALMLAGCSVVDVIDNLGEPTTPGNSAPSPDSAANPQPGAPGDSNARATLRAYYERERTAEKKEADPNNPIVRCKSQGQTQFIRKYDCEVRGGQVLS